MKRPIPTLGLIAGSLFGGGMLVNWHNHFDALQQWHNQALPVAALLSLAGWLIRRIWLGRSGEILPGLFLAFLARQLVHPLIPQEPVDSQALRLAWIAGLQVWLSLAAYLSLDEWTRWAGERIKGWSVAGGPVLGAASVALLLTLTRPQLAPPYLAVLGIALAASLGRVLVFKRPPYLLSVAALVFGAWFHAQDWNSGDADQGLRLGATLWLPLCTALLAFLWEQAERVPARWVLGVAAAAFVPNLFGASGLTPMGTVLLSAAALWTLGRFLSRVWDHGRDLPEFCADLGPPLRWAWDGGLVLLLLAFSSGQGDPAGAGAILEFTQEWQLLILLLLGVYLRTRLWQRPAEWGLSAGAVVLAWAVAHGTGLSYPGYLAAAATLLWVGLWRLDRAQAWPKWMRPWERVEHKQLWILAFGLALIGYLSGPEMPREARRLLLAVLVTGALRELWLKRPAALLLGMAWMLPFAFQDAWLPFGRLLRHPSPFALLLLAAALHLFWEDLSKRGLKLAVLLGALVVAPLLLSLGQGVEKVLWVLPAQAGWVVFALALRHLIMHWDDRRSAGAWPGRVRGALEAGLAQARARMPKLRLPARVRSGSDLWTLIRKNRRDSAKVAGVLALLAVFWGGLSWWRHSTARVENFTPAGLVASPNTVVQARFSKAVFAKQDDLSGSIVLEPPLPGQVSLADDRTLIFRPDAPLAPSTEYRARLDTGKLGTHAFQLQGSAETRFNTERFAVSNLRLYYNYDLLRQNETELIGEVDFNHPVAEESFRKALTVALGGVNQGFTVEKGLLPTRYFFRVGGVQRQEKSQDYRVAVEAGLLCDGCALGLEKRHEQVLTLEPLPRFELAGVKLHHTAGTSLVAVQFSLPITRAEAEKQIRVRRVESSGAKTPVNFNVEVEHAYAVLSADFLPNIAYEVVIREQMRSKSGRLIEASNVMENGRLRRADHVHEIQIEDAPAQLRFQDSGHYLPRGGAKILSVMSTNLDSYAVSGHRIFKNNLVHYLRDNGLNGGEDGRLGGSLAGHRVEVKGGQVNQEVGTQLDLQQIFGRPLEGLYNVRVRSERSYSSDRTWVLATDIGLSATKAGPDLWVQALSIGDLNPKAGLLLEIFSRENQVLRSARTDAEGRAKFENWNPAGAPMAPFVLVASEGEDLSFLELNRSPLQSSRFDTGGDPVSREGFEGFLSSERGIYRPGDELNLTAILRRWNLEAAGVPLELQITDPQWQVLIKAELQPDSEGLATFRLPLRAGALTGEYQAVINVKGRQERLAQCSFKVEDFIPNKIKADIELAAREAQVGGRIEYVVRAQHLFGAPASGLKVQTLVSLQPGTFEHPAYPGYRFSDDSRSFSSETLRVPQGVTDGKGAYPVSLEIPTSILPASMMLANVYGEVMDDGGRPVGTNSVMRIHRYNRYFGLKSKSGLLVDPGQRVQLSLVAIQPDGKKLKVSKVPVVVTRKRWYSLFRRNGWSESYQSSFYEEVVEARQVAIDGETGYSFEADQEGDYRVLVGDESGMRSSLLISVKGRHPEGEGELRAGDLQDPGALVLKLDKNQYLPGETARVEVNAPFAGRLHLSLERESVFERRALAVPAGRSVVEMPVSERLWPNAYVVGLLVRRPSENLRQLPMVSFGVQALDLDKRSRRISLGWDAPATVSSQQGLQIDLQTGEPGAHVVLAAVDEGILQIVNFSTPDPFAHFYRKRRLETQLLTFFDEVLPDLRRREGVGGDEDEGFERRHLNPVAAKRVKSFALYSGILTADAQGRVRHSFETGEFQGEARVMALAVRGKNFGSRAFRVKVADDLVVQPQLPRFLAPGDLIQMSVKIFNQTDQAQKIRVSVSLQGPLEATGKATADFELDAKSQQGLDFDLRAKLDAGVAQVRVTARLADGREFVKRIELAVRPGQTLSSDLRQGRLKPGQEVGLDVPGDYITFGRKARVHLSANPLYEFIGSLSYLLHYPYGCSEQMASQAFGLLALKGTGLLGGAFALASGSDKAAAEADKFVQAALRELGKMHASGGLFKLWPDSRAESGYLSDYISHFMLEAKRAGYQVDEELLRQIRVRIGAIQVSKQVGRLDRSLQNVVERGILDPYRLYLLALAGAPDRESARALLASDERMKAMGAFDRALLSMAFSETGDLAAARKALPDFAELRGRKLYRESGGRWSSSQRDLAACLMATAQAGAAVAELDPLIDEMRRRMKQGHFGSTQDNAWTFLALARSLKRYQAERPLRAEWRVGEGPATLLTEERSLRGDRDGLFGRTLRVQNRGEGPLAYILMAEGTRLTGTASVDSHGMKVSRVYRDEKGRELNLGSIVQGQLVVVTLKVECRQAVENLVVVDLLPAGFEVDNPRLQSQGRLGFTPDDQINAAYTDIRDDRVLLFTQEAQSTLYFSYSVRAVSPGTYSVPALLAEAMYEPEIYGRYDSGEKLVVVPNKF